MKTCEILGVNISNVTMEEAVGYAKDFSTNGVFSVFTPNPEIIMLAQTDCDYKNILNSANMLLPDGIGVVIASRLLKNPLPERVAGYDFVCNLLQQQYSFYLLGAKPHVVELAADVLTKKGVSVVGYHHGYFEQDDSIIKDINDKKPDVLLVCLGAPKQEKWIIQNKNRLPDCICIGAGGTLDVLAGEVKRAPEFYIKFNIEWLYRSVMQPSRFKRLFVIPKFLFKVLKGDGVKC
ncbi:MAG: WecB/TagA/CpsF family glycosyltransferase [Clostridiaceae bacterium]|nr:WecB/TagA/CpsF family glycosyltransferase [Clostridiaceae bacterium]